MTPSEAIVTAQCRIKMGQRMLFLRGVLFQNALKMPIIAVQHICQKCFDVERVFLGIPLGLRLAKAELARQDQFSVLLCPAPGSLNMAALMVRIIVFSISISEIQRFCTHVAA